MLIPSLALFRKEKRIILAFPLGFRLIYLTAAAVLLAAAAVKSFQNPLTLILFFIALLSGLYEERWIADRERGVLEARRGLLWPYKQHLYPFERITCFNLRFVMRGSLSVDPNQKKGLHTKPLLRLEAHLTDGEVLALEVDSAKKEEKMRRQGEALAAAAEKPLHREV